LIAGQTAWPSRSRRLGALGVTLPSAVTISAIVDETGAVLFGTEQPGRVSVTNFPAPGAAPLAPTAPSQLVTLVGFEGTSAACPDDGFGGRTSVQLDFRVLQGGGGAFDVFTIPAGQVLVVTRFEWAATGAAAGTTVRTQLLTESAGGFNVGSAQDEAVVDATGRASGSEQLGTGIVLSPNERLCVATGLEPTKPLAESSETDDGNRQEPAPTGTNCALGAQFRKRS
jgi:hypothetical protein